MMRIQIPIEVEVRGEMKSIYTLQTILDRLAVLRIKLANTRVDAMLIRGTIINEIEYLTKLKKRKFPND